MEIILDTANLEDIRRYNDIYDITGITSNPTILAKEKAEFFPLLLEIRSIIGEKQLHVQVTGSTCEEMLKEAEALTGRLGKDTYIKVPANEEGIKTMKVLKSRGNRVTATAIYMPQQAMLAASVGADYVAPYFNRMNNINVDSKKAIGDMAWLFEHNQIQTKIVAASFKNTQQVMDALMAGAQAVTVSPELYTQMVENPMIDSAIAGFAADWEATYGDKRIYEL
ncbi:fructose-6-phosphate aldolase [Muricomes sp. OA1]|uniref:Fructose-6-phosphate aldolase n=1 Tax=Hungatella hathewayi TaxID=154046 RepID=A0A3E2X0W4_9FIRM|nr:MULTISPECIES: fructose-6-phosphate aldolase [Clostridia]MCH1971281.1 fructose-6-phosphate aldolase [Muricomes sp. OA1]RGC34924.1 fructose-6-phosphate aldolase [Hungatella hathewayi]GKH34579.1 transaldolase [Faecalicatena contorta]